MQVMPITLAALTQVVAAQGGAKADAASALAEAGMEDVAGITAQDGNGTSKGQGLGLGTGTGTTALPAQATASPSSAARSPAMLANGEFQAAMSGPGTEEAGAATLDGALAVAEAASASHGGKPALAEDAHAGPKISPHAGQAGETTFTTGIRELAAVLDLAQQPANAMLQGVKALQGGTVALTPAEKKMAEAASAARDQDLRPTPLSALPVEIGMKALAGTKRFDIRLDPPELGRVDVRIEFGKDGEVSASLVVDRVETLHLLQRDARHLERAFDQAGLRTGEAGVQMSLSDRNANQGSGQPDGDGRSRGPGPDTTPSEISRALDAMQPVRIVRLGGVDVSV